MRLTSQSRAEIYLRIEDLLTSDYHYWLQRGSLEVEYGDLKQAELFLNHAHSMAPKDYKVDTEYGYLLMRKGIDSPQDGRAQSWVEEGIQLLEGVVGSRGEQDYYPYHVLGSQGLAWARRTRAPEEKRRLLLYFENVVQQGTRKHPRRRDLEQLLKAIQHDLLSTSFEQAMGTDKNISGESCGPFSAPFRPPFGPVRQ